MMLRRKFPEEYCIFPMALLRSIVLMKRKLKRGRGKKRRRSNSKLWIHLRCWIPWLVYLAWIGATGTLRICDAAGEKLAWWLGITSPKYYYEIQEAKRMQKEEEERKNRQDAEMAGWVGESEGGLVRSQEEVRGKETGAGVDLESSVTSS